MSGRRNGIVVPSEAILLRPRVTFDVANEKIAAAGRAKKFMSVSSDFCREIFALRVPFNIENVLEDSN